MTKAVFQIGSRIFRSEFMTMRSTVSASTLPAEASTAAAAANNVATCRLQRRAKVPGRLMACPFGSGQRDATQPTQRKREADCGRRTDRAQLPQGSVVAP